MMQKLTILSVLLVLSFSINAKVKKASEESLSDDLNYRLDQSSDYDREVASEDQATTEDNNSQDSDREVASENEDTAAPIRYWKY
jgi:hypothetical protein